jgi:ubiquinone biosynthesis protein UbiJ
MTDPRPCAEFDELIAMLRAEGHVQVAQRLHTLLHEVTWTTASELMGELGLEIVRFQCRKIRGSPELQELTQRCMTAVKKAWPNIEKVR